MRKSVPTQVLAFRKRAGLSLADLAKRMGYRQPSSIQRYESDTDFRGEYLPSKFAMKLASALDGLGSPPITEREILDLAGPIATSGRKKPVPVISYVQAGEWTQSSNAYELGDGFAEIYADSAISNEAFALEIQGDSMLPRFLEGDRIIIDPKVNYQPGDFVVAKQDNEGTATFKQYRPRGTDARGKEIFELKPLNDNWYTIVVDAKSPGRIIGPMVEHHSYRRTKK